MVIGAGPNGLVAANILAQEGLDVVVCEEQPAPGGAVRTAELTLPGFRHDVFSAFYPFAAASPAMRGLELERWGLRWRRAPLAVAHPTFGGPTAVLSADVEETAESLERFAAGDGQAWRRLHALWERIEAPFMRAFTTPFPPVRAGGALARRLGPRQALEVARIATLPLRRFAQETFRGEGGRLLIGGNALHTDVGPGSPGGALFGWILCGLGQRHGFPVPDGGAGRLTDALVRRLESHGGEVICDARVTRVLVRRGRAAGVRLVDGREVEARAGVLADVGAPQLYRDLVDPEVLPTRVLRSIEERFEYDHATVKVDWALSAPIPWSSEDARRAGTIHTGDGFECLSDVASTLERGLIPARPFLVLGQYAAMDPGRSPPGTETAWAYAHVPQRPAGDAGGQLRGRWDEAELAIFAGRIEADVERLAPGFGDLILARHVAGPHELERADRNLVNGAVNGGTAKYRQQLLLRPVPGLGRPETAVRRLLLASASAHPGGGVHGAPGAIAARALLRKLRDP